MKNHKMWIGGEWVSSESGKTFPTFNPATGEEIAEIPFAGENEVNRAVEAARASFRAWSEKTQAERSQIILRIADAIKKNAEELVKLEVIEHGTPIEEAERAPMGAAGKFEWASQVARSLVGDVIPAVPDVVTYLRREPIGVCAAITPWNHSLGMMATKLALALSVGNTCILKPPSVNSLMGLKLAEILEGLEIPPGVVNVITGPGSSVGRALASHPDVDLITFTGSSETGKDLMVTGGKTMKRFVMELGGKNPVIVLEDADLDAAVKFLAPRQYHNTGQHCSGAGRYYVHEKVYDDFVEQFVALSKNVVVGDPADPKTSMGPVANKEHRDRIEAHIQSGLEEGAKLLLGGDRPTTAPMNKGWFVMPTVFSKVNQNMRIAREEIFGPVAVIMEPFSSEEEVIELANDTRYGLCATIWTKDMAKGLKFISRLQAGTVNINTQVLTPDIPWGGYKESGIGKEYGMAGITNYTQFKLVNLKIEEPSQNAGFR